MATRVRESRATIEKQIKTAKQRKNFIGQNRAMLPTRLDVEDGEVISGAFSLLHPSRRFARRKRTPDEGSAARAA